MQALRLFYPAFLSACVAQLPFAITPTSSTRASMIARLEYLLAGTLGVHHDDLEEVLEVHVEKLDQRLAQLGTGSARPRLECRNIVLADAQVVCQLTLCQALLFAHRPQPGRPNLDIHLGIITRFRIFFKACLQKRLARRSPPPLTRPAGSSCPA